MPRQKQREHIAMKVTSYWFTIPRIWRRSLFWLIMLLLAVFGWIKLLSNGNF